MFDSVQHIHFIGIGGAGMVSLAQIFHDMGKTVTGSDLIENENTDALKKRGIKIKLGHASDLPEKTEFVIYSAAVPHLNPERKDAQEKKIPSLKRGEALAEIVNLFPISIAIAGSHGKTTTTAMLQHLLQQLNLNPGYMIGGKVPGLEATGAFGDGKVFVTEVDESDGSQALVHATVGIILNMEDDHAWSHGGVQQLFACFQKFAKQTKHLLLNENLAENNLFDDHPNTLYVKEAPLTQAIRKVILGPHNRHNASFAIQACEYLSIPPKEALPNLLSFKGVDRRFKIHHENSDSVILEDYAHHPTEVNVCLSTIRESWPNHYCHVIFQPHRYERIKRYHREFGKELSLADELTLVSPFAAWVNDQDLEKPEIILESCSNQLKKSYSSLPFDLLVDQVITKNTRPVVYAILGAGDIDALIPKLLKRVK
ncbi:MAG: Mur ligase domain-containing protein [Lentisphaeria bacterium]|nr:Mur ligase domain-containing protein [Lentisphaeria bacterium]